MTVSEQIDKTEGERGGKRISRNNARSGGVPTFSTFLRKKRTQNTKPPRDALSSPGKKIVGERVSRKALTKKGNEEAIR